MRPPDLPDEIEVRPIAGYDGYFVTSHGEVWSYLNRWKGKQKSWMKRTAHPNGNGYLAVSIRPDGQRNHQGRCRLLYIHHLVLEAFVGPRGGDMIACHVNDVPTDNRLENLRWSTRRGNSLDAIRNGRIHKGERAVHTKLSDEDIRVVRYLARRGATAEAIAVAFGVGYVTVQHAITGKDRFADL